MVTTGGGFPDVTAYPAISTGTMECEAWVETCLAPMKTPVADNGRAVARS
jgi:hypothetical protein